MVRAALALGITVLSGIPQSTIVKAQAVGGSGGFLEISSVFFGESGRTFMAGEVIALSGAIPYIGGCLGQLAHGGFLPQGRGEGRFDPFPTADFYVIADTGGSLGLLQKLNDVSGGVNRVIGLSSGAFVDETIAVTQPAGNLGAGRFDVVMDQCLDGYFDPGIDIVLGEGQSYAFEVVLPGTLPALSLHAVKEAAGVYAAFLEDNDQDLPGGARIEVPGFCTRFNKWQDSAAIDAASSFGIWTAVARNKCVDLTKHYKGIQDDPPDPNYTQFAELGALSYHEGAATSPLERAMRTLAGVMSDQAATARAILTTLERFQGARQAGDDLYTVLQLEELNKFIHLLTDGGGSALRFYAALEAFDIALAQDPSGQSAEATALREGLLTMRRAIGGLITPFGAGFVRKVLGPGQEVLLPNGLRAWTEVYLGRNPFLPPLGLPGIPQTRAFAGLPALAFQHPDALFLGPLVSPPHRPLAFDATRSTDPNGDPLTFAWDFDGDGAFDDDAGPQPQHTFPEAGTRLVGVKATDTAGNTDVFYELVKIGDVNSQDIIARSTFGELLRIRPDGSVVTLNPTQGGAQALHVDVNGDTWVLTPENLEHYDANGAWLKTISVPQFAALAGTPLIQFHDFAIDGRGDLLVLATQNRGPGQIELTPGAFTPTGALQGHVTLYRMPKDASSVSFVAAVHEPWVMTTIDGLQTALLCSTGAAIPGLALDRNGDVVVAGVNGLNAARNQQGIFAVDPHSGQTREVVPAGRVSNCAPVGDDPRFPPYFGVIIAVGGQSLNIQLGGGRSSGGVEVDSQGHYVMGRGNSVAGPVRLYRVPMPPTMTFQPLPGLIAGQVLLDVFPTYLSPFPSPAFIAFSDIAIDSSGDYLVGGDHTTLGRGIFRIDPTGILSRVSDARGPFSAIRALDVVPDIREVTPKDIPLPPSIRLSNLTVDQQGCPGDIDIDVVLTNTGTDAVAHPIRVWFWNGDPGAGGTVIGTADVSSLGAAGAQASFRWANPPAGTATIFVTAEGANSLARAQYVCASLPAPQSDTIVLSPATATHAVGTQHVVTATMLDIYGRPLAGAPLTFQVDGANTTTGTAVTDAAGVATFHYDGTHAGEDTISASFVGATSNDALAAWSGVGDMTPPILTLPANLPVPATSPSGATVTFVASATDNVDGSVPVTCSAMSGALFGLGTTTVDCLASDAAGNTVTGTFVVTVAVGAPRIAGSVAAKGRDQTGNFYVDVRLANTGTGHARNVGITLIPLRTLGGTGIVTLNGALSPPLPVSLGALDVGASTIVRLYLHVPGTVSRLSVTESGPLTNVLGTVYAYSTAQAVIP